MNIERAITFVFEDEDWIIKVVLGALIMLIPIFGPFAMMGYALAVIRNVKAGAARPLPAWQNLGQYFVDGLVLMVCNLIYALPMFVFACPIMLVGLLPALGGDNPDVVGVLGGLSGLTAMVLSCPMTLYGILLGFVSYALQIRYAETGELQACLRFGEIFRFVFQNLGQLVIVLLLMMGIGIVIAPVSLVTLGLLTLPISFWTQVVMAHLLGQVSRQV